MNINFSCSFGTLYLAEIRWQKTYALTTSICSLYSFARVSHNHTYVADGYKLDYSCQKTERTDKPNIMIVTAPVMLKRAGTVFDTINNPVLNNVSGNCSPVCERPLTLLLSMPLHDPSVQDVVANALVYLVCQSRTYDLNRWRSSASPTTRRSVFCERIDCVCLYHTELLIGIAYSMMAIISTTTSIEVSLHECARDCVNDCVSRCRSIRGVWICLVWVPRRHCIR